jgi:hypothetical protein
MTFFAKTGKKHKKIELRQAPNLSPVKNNHPHSKVCFEVSAIPSPQKDNTNHQPSGSPAACKDSPPPLQNMTFDPMAFLKEWGEKMQMMHQHQPQTIVVKSRADKSCESKAKFNNNMLQHLLIAGDVKFVPPGSFGVPRIPVYMQAMSNILAQPSTVHSTHMVNILTTCFSWVPTDISERLSPFTTRRSMQHISKKFASALLSANIQCTPLNSLKFKVSSITILIFVG